MNHLLVIYNFALIISVVEKVLQSEHVGLRLSEVKPFNSRIKTECDYVY